MTQVSLDVIVCLRHKSAFGLALTLTFDLWPLTLKTFSSEPTHLMIIYAEFY